MKGNLDHGDDCFLINPNQNGPTTIHGVKVYSLESQFHCELEVLMRLIMTVSSKESGIYFQSSSHKWTGHSFHLAKIM